jgi:hypothetical protein
MINQHINYAQVFQVVCCKLVPLLDLFKSPNLIWNMINYLSFILEKNIEQPDAIVECLKYLNILRILQNQTQCHVDEAIIDMLKSLITQCPSSQVILDMCCVLLDFKLSKSLTDKKADGNTIMFWLFTMRAVASENPALGQLKELFMKFSSLLTLGNIQNQALGVGSSSSVANTFMTKDHIFIDFLKVTMEAILLNMFQSETEIQQLTLFAIFKFQQEVANQKKQLEAAEKGQIINNLSSGCDSSDSDGGGFDQNVYEKLLNILQLTNVLLMKAQKTSEAFLEFMFQ